MTAAGNSPTGASRTLDYTPEERRWKAEDPFDPRPDCPDRDQHAHRMYGDRWEYPGPMRSWAYSRLDGHSVARTHRQVRCEGCGRFMVYIPRTSASAERSSRDERP